MQVHVPKEHDNHQAVQVAVAYDDAAGLGGIGGLCFSAANKLSWSAACPILSAIIQPECPCTCETEQMKSLTAG